MRTTAIAAIVSAFAATGAVGVGIGQIKSAIAANRRQATFAHLRAVASAFRAVRPFDPGKSRRELLAWYRNQSVAMSDGAERYLDFLTELDLLGLAYTMNSVECATVIDYMKGLLINEYAVSVIFIDQLRAEAKDPTIFQHLYQLAAAAREAT